MSDRDKPRDDGQIYKGEALWTDREGVSHWAVGQNMVRGQANTRLLWTICGHHDIPANGAIHAQHMQKPTCAECLEYEGDGLNDEDPMSKEESK